MSDNGPGGARPPTEGAGLAGLRRRIAALGGKTAIEHDGGMRIRVELPLDAGAEPGAA